MTNSQLKLIILEISAKSMINKLDETYLVRSCTNKLPIKRKLLYLKFNKNENPMDFFNTLEKQLDELRNAGGNVNNEDKLNYSYTTFKRTCK